MIQHIYVVDVSGVPIYASCVGHEVCPLSEFDTIAVSGLLTALNNLAKEMGGGDLQAIHMQKAKFILKAGTKFFIVFQVEPEEKIGKYQRGLENFSTFIQSIYPNSEPFDKKYRIKMIPEIENFLNESNILVEKDLIKKIKSFPLKIFKKSDVS